HCAWMNGAGMMVWEIVFGSQVPWNPHDRSLLRSMLPIQRRFTRLFSGEGWAPLVPVLQNGLFASLWEAEGVRLWTLVNRTSKKIVGPLLSVRTLEDHRYFDLIAGSETHPTAEAGGTVLYGAVPARDIGCFVSGKDADLGKDFTSFLRAQARSNGEGNLSSATPKVITELLPVRPGRVHSRPPAGMV